MKTALFDFDLPPDLIAQVPAPERPASRLLVLDRATGTVSHRRFADLAELIPPGDLLVVNRSRVIPARLFTVPEPGQAAAEIVFVEDLGAGRCLAMVRPGRRFRSGRVHALPGGGRVRVEAVRDDGLRVLQIEGETDSVAVFRRYGEMPLPPYITSRESDPDRYQTVFAREEGSVAAPTAGLHFDAALLDRLRNRGVHIGEILLHVGLGTFKPIETDEIEDHHMHAERYCVEPGLADTFARVRAAGGKIWACGTTSVRTLESAIQSDGTLATGWRETSCFLRPGHVFRAVDHLITNFHLPRSTLLVLVAAFAGLDQILAAYREAVAARYRFFSFGDAMVIL
ncbi:MAG: S-adenosylmethionine:tRNA ribosyltransferase-isomerase [Candidatus Ozemobacter sibiricus]|uniref:S-adenosylmethionine:tRNA ribosyltransferase-isomerase n=1 Tax=Candidatus Ozemobacter sibiricus TaxID=2268124 RepID=A0A367ZQH3_9BACT|nr:MAG: S-adenosylmethionine:tRNA ribosyltransferase-isomerase [Candidatus Ozemobacter sibiricus]